MNKKIETITLFKFKCHSCSNEFLSNDKCTLFCTICGTKLTKNSQVEVIEMIDKRELNAKIDGIIKSLDSISDANNKEKEKDSIMADFVIDFMNEYNIEIPSGGNLSINLGWQYDETPWQFLSSVKFNFMFDDKANIEEHLKTAINNNFSITDLIENPIIILKK